MTGQATKASEPGQLPLPLADFHSLPLVSRGRDASGHWTGTFRRPAAEAFARFPHVQHDPPAGVGGVWLDLDVPGAAAAAVQAGTVPFPTALMTRKANGHAAAAYVLASPVHAHPRARPKPRQLLGRVSEYLAASLHADPHYTACLFRNANVAARDPRFHVDRTGQTWQLGELADWIPKGWHAPRVRFRTAIGRNVSLHRALLRYAGSDRVNNAQLELYAWTANQGLEPPMGDAEVRDILSSVLRRREHWRANGWHAKSFRARQSARGRRSGLKRGQGVEERNREIRVTYRSGGVSQRALAADFGLSVGGVNKILRRQREECSLNQRRIDRDSPGLFGEREIENGC